MLCFADIVSYGMLAVKQLSLITFYTGASISAAILSSRYANTLMNSLEKRQLGLGINTVEQLPAASSWTPVTQGTTGGLSD
jgi:hypothetical protein